MRITEFNHTEERITFKVICNGQANLFEIDKMAYGTSMTDIDDFTVGFSNGDYYKLEEFVSACTSLLM